MKRFLHWLAHIASSNRGQVITWWDDEKLMVGLTVRALRQGARRARNFSGDAQMNDPIENAARLLREEALAIAEKYANPTGTLGTLVYVWSVQSTAKDKYDELIATADALDVLNDERIAWNNERS